MEASKYLLTGFVLIICAFVLQLTGLASPYWISFEFSQVKGHSGLWKLCATVEIQNINQCSDYGFIPDWLIAVRATSIMGFILLLVALGMTVLKMFVMKEKKQALFAAIGSAFIAALFILISIAVYATKVEDLTTSNSAFNYNFAFVFCIIAMLAAIGAGSGMVVDAVITKVI